MLRLSRLTKSYPARGGAVRALDDVTLEVPVGGFVTLLGPSGSGKTTALRCVAGLERPDAGDIEVGGRTLFSAARRIDVSASDRGLGFVPQAFGLWPHLTAARTVAFPLEVMPRRRRPSRREIAERVERALATVRLAGVGDRNAAELSGGQQQRLALARALVTEPPVLLMDEPLANVDAPVRDDLRIELKRIQQELGVTVLYVTHDQAEALALGTVVAVMRDGRVAQVGDPREVYERPASAFVADFVGRANVLAGVAEHGADGSRSVRTPAGALPVDPGPVEPGGLVAVAVRAERVRVSRHAVEGSWRGVVQARAYRGDAVDHVVALDGLELRVRSDSSLSFPPGTEVAVDIDESACLVLGAADGDGSRE
jgi:iron(III) transport system ATP-binding protein